MKTRFTPHYTYLCSSSTGAGSTERKTVKALQANQSKPIQKFSTQTAHHVRAILNGPKTNPMLVRDAPINRDFIKPRTVFLVKPGPRPREVKRFLLTARTAHSFEQLLDDFNDQLGGLLHGRVLKNSEIKEHIFEVFPFCQFLFGFFGYFTIFWGTILWGPKFGVKK